MFLFFKVKTAAWIKGWIAGICMIAALIAVCPARAELVDRIVAIVNNDIVLLSELEQATALSKSPVVSAEERKAILDQLIDDKLTLQQVTALGIVVSEEQVDATIERIREVNKVSQEAMTSMLAMEGLTLESFKKKINNQMLQNQLVNLEVKSKIVITDEDVKAYYDANPELYAGQVKYHLRQLLVKVDQNASEKEKSVKIQQIKDIQARLQKGEDFAGLAEMYSQALTASSGGDLGFFETRLLAPQIYDALKDLKAGQFSDIVETDQGYQLFFVEDIQVAGAQSLEEASEAIETKLYSERMEEKFKLWLADLRNKAHIRMID